MEKSSRKGQNHPRSVATASPEQPTQQGPLALLLKLADALLDAVESVLNTIILCQSLPTRLSYPFTPALLWRGVLLDLFKQLIWYSYRRLPHIPMYHTGTHTLWGGTPRPTHQPQPRHSPRTPFLLDSGNRKTALWEGSERRNHPQERNVLIGIPDQLPTNSRPTPPRDTWFTDSQNRTTTPDSCQPTNQPHPANTCFKRVSHGGVNLVRTHGHHQIRRTSRCPSVPVRPTNPRPTPDQHADRLDALGTVGTVGVYPPPPTHTPYTNILSKTRDSPFSPEPTPHWGMDR